MNFIIINNDAMDVKKMYVFFFFVPFAFYVP